MSAHVAARPDASPQRADLPGATAAVRRAVRRRARIVVVAALVALLVVSGLALMTGDYPLEIGQVWRTLLGGGERVEQYVVLQVRAPRLAMAIVVGGCLGIAGALLQGLLRNPLASPDLLGISGGSSVAAVFLTVILGVSGAPLAIGACAGGMIVAALLLLAGRRGADGGYRLILAGIGITFLCASVTSYLLASGKVELAQAALIWITGTLSASSWAQVLIVAAVLVVTLPAVIAAARWLPLTQLGPQTAAGLGVRPDLVRWVVVVAAVVLTSATTAFAGPIAFVALCAPAIARPLLGHGAVGVATSALLGATMLASADLVAQFAVPGLSFPVGIVTGALGAVFLLCILATSKGRQL